MAFILSPTAAPAAAASAAPATARFDEQGQGSPRSFGDVLARSLEPAGEKTKSAPAKTAHPASARRQADPQKTDAADLVNTLALPFAPLEVRMARPALPGTAGSSADAAATEPLEARKAGPALPGAVGTSSLASTDAATAGIATALTEPLAAQASLAPDKAGKKAAGHTPLQATVAAAGDGIASQIDAPATAEVTGGAKGVEVASAVMTAASARGDGQDIRVLSESADASAELAPASAQGNGQTAASAAALAAGTAKLPAAGVPVTPAAVAAVASAPGAVAASTPAATTAANTASVSTRSETALPAQETTAALQASGDVFAPAAPHAGASAAPKRTRDADDSASPQASALQAANAPAAGNPAGTDASVSASVGSAFAMNLPAALQTSGGPSAATVPTAGANAPALAPEVGNSEWGKALGQQVVQMGTAGHQVAELQLNPPGLGPLKITLSMNDHQLQAMFSSAHASVRAAVEAALPQLRATLAESGLSLGNTSVGAETQQQSAFSNGQDRQPERASYYRQAEMADTAAAFALRNAAEPVRTLGGLRIDTYA